MTRSLDQGFGDRIDELEAECRMRVGYRFDDLSPIPWARDAVLPTLAYQVREDRMTFPADIQAIFDAIPTEKRLH